MQAILFKYNILRERLEVIKESSIFKMIIRLLSQKTSKITKIQSIIIRKY